MAMLIEGNSVKDARRRIILEVTKQDCERGQRKQITACPIALRVAKEFAADEVRVHRSRIYVLQGTVWTRYSCSRALNIEICVFDRGGGFQPGKYVIYAPQPSIKLGTHRVRNPQRRTGPHGRRFLPVHVMQGVRGRPAGWER